ncbi:hypothetical protein SARC_03092 [Sphaeroforma arctica JP610]|uniref:Aspartate/glutamate/uridylate kinase domain-containing protein n=1 Tax=Sphaeroforma arctica JP610 TaxID=667725 RepID=A0A0L0G6P7_9EUKA|nr:hypothetical protein SARC_03092 [Sphaeroforma arctica JP610]KNC84687.1 hypothetical protein SARC_03092 [Sphaeroforma arctica JP610]|eukprot:XP_014158589.1 hypothetical protein SARC_03092 [Sphaeroforma arctica JP610]
MQRSEYGAAHHVPALPLEIIDAQTEGQIGYQLTQAIRNALVSQGQRDPRVCAVVNQVRVEADDKAFQTPTKPVGGFFSEQEAKAKMETDQWDMIEQQGRGWRRVVASPEPKEIIEQWAIESLMEKGGIVICVGGGGIPVVRDTDTGDLKGVAAVIDKDSASALLADHMQFDAVVFCTGVANVYVDFNTPSQRTLTAMNVQQAQQHMKDGHFPAGSMGPKVAAALGFLEQTNKGGRERKCYITDPEHLLEALDGNSEHGTVITV